MDLFDGREIKQIFRLDEKWRHTSLMNAIA